MKKRMGILGIIALSVVTALVVGVGGGMVLADFMYSNQTQGRIGTIGSGAGVYLDSNCTQAVTSNSNLPSFGAINLDLSVPKSGTITLFFRNEGQTRLSPNLSVTGLASGFLMQEGNLGVLSATPIPLMGYVFQSSSLPSTPTLGPSDTSLFTSLTPGGTIPPTLPQQGYFKWDNEIVKYSSWSGGTIQGITRGYLSSPITSHAQGIPLVWGDVVPNTIAPNAVKTITLSILADSSVKVGNPGSDFVVNIVAGAGVQ